VEGDKWEFGGLIPYSASNGEHLVALDGVLF